MRRRVSCSVIQGRRQAAGILLALVLAGCGGSSSSAPATSPGEASPSGAAAAPTAPVPSGPIPLIIDNDMSFDDVMAIAYLTAQPGVEILAVTVTGTGIAHCGPGARNVRNLLNELQAPAVPTACGSEEPVAGGKVFPEEWRTGADGLWGLKVAGVPGTPKGTAVDLLAEVIGGSDRPVTVLATGPLTNLAQALAADPKLADGIARIVIMGGAVDVDGNATVDGSPAPAEWNFAADPAAADAVFASGIPITLVPLDATNDVKITRTFADRLHADASAGPANLVDELLLRTPGSIDVDYFWDALAATMLIEPAVATTEEARIAVTTEGPEAGRTIRSDGGTAMTLATAADRAAFEKAFLAGLRAGGPRRTPLEVKDDLAVHLRRDHLRVRCRRDGAGGRVLGFVRERFEGRVGCGRGSPDRGLDLRGPRRVDPGPPGVDRAAADGRGPRASSTSSRGRPGQASRSSFPATRSWPASWPRESSRRSSTARGSGSSDRGHGASARVYGGKVTLSQPGGSISMCAILLAALVGPRAINVVWWLLDSERWASTFSGPLVPILGILALPWTTLAYVLVAPGGLTGLEFIVVVIGLFVDIGTYGSSAYSNKDKIGFK